MLLSFSSKKGYSFIAPSILFNRNAVTADVLEAALDRERPGSATVARSAMMKVTTIRGMGSGDYVVIAAQFG